jgi:hypothetical protein
MITRKKLIEVALPLEKINLASAREKSIRHGHPSTLYLWSVGWLLSVVTGGVLEGDAVSTDV